MLNTNKYRLSGIAVAVALSVTACGGSKNVAPEAFNVSVEATKSWIPVQGNFIVSDANTKDTLRISAISENGVSVQAQQGQYRLSNGVLTVQGTAFTYVPLNDNATQVSYTVTDGKLNATATLSIAAPVSDPLAYQQWHLRNTGQAAYSLTDAYKNYVKNLFISDGQSEEEASADAEDYITELKDEFLVPGQDMNVAEAYAQGITGHNAIAVVVDSGLEIRHEDLVDNVLPNRSLNLSSSAVDKTDPTANFLTGDHGTSVAGLIAAKGWNGIGGRGVAPDAKLIGMNLLGGNVPASAYIELLVHGFPGSGISLNEPVVAFNRSYGYTFPLHMSYSTIEEETQHYTATQLRSGLGAVNVKSSGNSFEDGYAGNTDWTGDLCEVIGANDLGLSCINANAESSQTTPYYVSVGAVNSNGLHTSYSSAGSNLLVAAPAGEYGTWAPAMVTTDQMTCLRGYSSFERQAIFGESRFAGLFPFNNPGHPENPSCNYTSTFNGTSSAAPNTSGVIALIADANPQLSFREIRDILVRTSTKVDPNNQPVVLDVGSEGKFVAHTGWTTNAAGYAFNNLYGFGRVNAGAAVKLALNYDKPLGDYVESDWIGLGTYAENAASLELAIPDNSAEGASVSIEVTDDITLEGAQFMFTVRNPEIDYGLFYNVQTTAGIDLAIEVTSPAGTKSVLLSSKQALTLPALDTDTFNFNLSYLLKDSAFLSNAFYGENAKGTWTIRLLDTNGSDYNSRGGDFLDVDGFINNTTPSVVEGVSIRVFGH